MANAKKVTKAPSKKLLEAAKEYLFAHAIWCQSDCSDSYTAMGEWEHTYEFISEDKMPIQQFIKKNLKKEIEEAKANYEDCSGEKWDNNPTVAPFLGR